LTVNRHGVAIGTPAYMSNAALNGNLNITEVLLACGADVNAACSPEFGGTVKEGKIALSSLTPLLVASIYRPYNLARLLLDAGASVNTRDVRNMTARHPRHEVTLW
jgi:Ankyrin repeat